MQWVSSDFSFSSGRHLYCSIHLSQTFNMHMQSLSTMTLSSEANATDTTLLNMELEGLESRNRELEQRCSNLQTQLSKERKTLMDVTNSMQFDMDRMKKTISELENLLGALLQSSANKSDATALSIGALLFKDSIRGNDQNFEGKQNSEVELLRTLCKIWKNKYIGLKMQHDCNGKVRQLSATSASQNVQEQQVSTAFPRRSSRNSVKNISSLKNLARGRSMPPKKNKVSPSRDMSTPPRTVREIPAAYSDNDSVSKMQHSCNRNTPQPNTACTNLNAQEQQVSTPFLRRTSRNSVKNISSLKNLARGRSMPPKRKKVSPLRDKSIPPRIVREIPSYSDSVSVTEL